MHMSADHASADYVSVSLSIDASPREIWGALATAKHEWWPDMTFEAIVGAPLVERWMDGDKEKVASGTVTHAEAPHMLAFEWTEPEWGSATAVRITLESIDRHTKVSLVESGFCTIAGGPEIRAAHEEGWRYHLDRLRAAAVSPIGRVDS